MGRDIDQTAVDEKEAMGCDTVLRIGNTCLERRGLDPPSPEILCLLISSVWLSRTFLYPPLFKLFQAFQKPLARISCPALPPLSCTTEAMLFRMLQI